MACQITKQGNDADRPCKPGTCQLGFVSQGSCDKAYSQVLDTAVERQDEWVWNFRPIVNREEADRVQSEMFRAQRGLLGLEILDLREPGESFCADCPDHEACSQAAPCSLVKRVNRKEPSGSPLPAPREGGSPAR